MSENVACSVNCKHILLVIFSCLQSVLDKRCYASPVMFLQSVTICLNLARRWMKAHAFTLESFCFGSPPPCCTFVPNNTAPGKIAASLKPRLPLASERTSFPAREPRLAAGPCQRIVKLDISLNELEELRTESLLPFENLRELDASLNTLSNVEGVGVLPSLAVLNLSYNAVTSVRGLEPCRRLVLLNLSHNRVKAVRDLPSLSSLTQLHLHSNKLKSLDGIQGLPQLRELYIQNNTISSLLPLSSSLTLNILDASNNEITSLMQTLQILRALRRLKQLHLKALEGEPADPGQPLRDCGERVHRGGDPGQLALEGPQCGSARSLPLQRLSSRRPTGRRAEQGGPERPGQEELYGQTAKETQGGICRKS
ncbi:dynein assembly factor 1, axonemal-like isoform X4 [Rhinatrema bivittatum]|uniref:dynein assembly factor 1, axonemal-like isoform X4 n=1 Tax=Rhinatrema bivittatum TaxID=194408 RepID=UPI00112E1901|nr:dynein assembly factor 1, axonemal-like isoform X4 [Rhinatrema bivittatum]